MSDVSPPNELQRVNVTLPQVHRVAEPPKPDACWACDGVGFVRRVVEPHHPDFGKAAVCVVCHPPSVSFGVPGRLSEATFENFDLTENPLMQQAMERCVKVAEGGTWCALLTGDIGVGKSHLAAAAIAASVHPKPGLFWSHGELLLWLRKQMFDDDGPRRPEEEVISYFQDNPALLVVDDIGTAKATEWAQQTLYSILNGRYEARLPTILTSNDAAALDERLVSRFYEGLVFCEGRDVRKTARGA